MKGSLHRVRGRAPVALVLAIALALVPLTQAPAHRVQASASPPMYTVTDLGSLGGALSGATAINNRGQVVGGSLTATPDPTNPGATELRAFLWHDGVMTDLGTLGGPDAYIDRNGNLIGATAINDQGRITGGATYNAVVDPLCGTESEPSGAPCNHAFVWAKGTMTDLGTLGGVTALGNSFSVGFAINARGQVAGMSSTTVPDPYDPGHLQQHAFLWERGVMTDLGTLPSPLNTYSQAFGINERGEVVGESGFRDAAGHPFFWSNGVMTDIGTLGGRVGFALAINNRGQVVGGADTTIPDPTNPGGVLAHAFLWTPGHMQDLGSTPDEPLSEAHGINNRGQIVGLGCCAGDNLRALLWQGGRVFDLNTLIPATAGWYLGAAAGINDRGQIVGGGINPQGQAHAFLLTPAPGHIDGGNATSIAAQQARATAALARLPASVRHSLTRFWPGRVRRLLRHA